MKIKDLPNKNKNQKSLPKLADDLVSGTKNILREAKTEEDLRIGFEKLLDPLKTELNLKSTPKYEKSVYSGRSDAMHGQVIIEYEPPKSFSSKKNIDHAYDQLVNYLSDEAKETKLKQLVGVGFDGEQIFFIQYPNLSIRGPYNFNPESARTFLIHLRALSRLPLTAENLAQKFGPQSELAPKMVSALANALEYWGNQTHTRTFFNEWKRLFGIVYGEQFTGGQQEKEAETLSKLYRVGKDTDFQELLFSVHTYFAFLMKLIAAELLTLRETSFSSSLTSQLAHIPDDELKKQLEDIENGGVYARKGITNFLEGDFFRWYLDTFESPELKEAIREIGRALSEFEPATSTLDPVSTRDLLKKLYQYLVPQEVRHRLGEYYTPDWLAELLLNEVGYDGNTLKRFLDPACGSGTFLVLAIQRAKEHGQKEKWSPLEIAKRIVANIWGFDLNPLAVIAARTNYLFALGDLANELPRVEIPIYLTDSVLTPTRTTGNLFGEFLEVSTSVGKFQVPAEWVRDGGFLLADAAPLVEEMTKNLPQELVEINKVLTTLNNNSWAVHHLFKKARRKKQHANAFLYFFYSFELTLKHLIISEMNFRNIKVALENIKKGSSFFPIYNENELLKILDLGPVGKLIQKFLEIFGNNIKNDLWKINGERNDIIHNMLKREMSEVNIEQSFEKFFQKSDSAIKNAFKAFDSILAKRPENFLEKLTEALGSSTDDLDGLPNPKNGK